MITADVSESVLIYLDVLPGSSHPLSILPIACLRTSFSLANCHSICSSGFLCCSDTLWRIHITAFRLKGDGFSYGILVMRSVSRRLYTVQRQMMSMQTLTITVILAVTPVRIIQITLPMLSVCISYSSHSFRQLGLPGNATLH